jgi:putative peptidoglycan lipid II flippase
MTKKILLSLFIPMLLGLGIVSSFFREMVIAYYYGSSKEVEIYRIAFSIPYALFQSLGTILIASLLPLYLSNRNILPQIQSSIKKVFIVITVLAIITLPWQAVIFAPGFTEDEQSLLLYNMLISWSIVLIAAFIFPMRLLLQSNDKKVLVSATSLLFSLFLVSMIILLHKKLPGFELSVASVVSVVGIYFVYRWDSDKKQLISPDIHMIEEQQTINKIIIGSFIYILLLTMPRMIDKALASQMSDGVIANLDYAMNFYVAFGVLIGTSFTIIYAKKIANEYRGKSMNLKWMFQLLGIPFILASLISLSIYPYTELIVSLAYNRGAFSASNTIEVATILNSFLIALPLMVVGMMLSQIVAAYSIFVLISVILIKISTKWLWIKLKLSTTKLAVFGESTLVMELLGIVVIMFILIFYSRRKGPLND